MSSKMLQRSRSVFTALKYFTNRALAHRKEMEYFVHSRTLVRHNSFGPQQNGSSTEQNAALRASISQQDQVVLLSSAESQDARRFPFVWLRDNCQCEACFHQESQSRTIDLMSFDVNVEPSQVSIVKGALKVVWNDGHTSTFNSDWLHERSFNKRDQDKWLSAMFRLPRTTWDADSFPRILSRYDFNAVLNCDKELYEWLVSLATFGVSIVEGAPPEDSTIRRLANRVAFIRKTHYGEEFSVRAKPGTTNVAYLSANLQIHTDLPYYHYKPGVNLLHCLVQTDGEGGANMLADALAVAEWLREESPSMYRALVSTMVDWNDVGHEDENYFHSLHRAPVICENKFGVVERINFSQPQRDSHFAEPEDKVKDWYKAMDKLTKALLSDKFCVTYKMKEGEILTFNNHRLVHGRSQYEDKESVRHVVGGYLDWDEIWSRIRVLKKKLGA